MPNEPIIKTNLSKENFWNELQEKYPNGMRIFCNWIDKYKKENDWNKLFNSDSDWQDSNGKNAPAPKFHDIPLAMQIGIWMEFVKSFGGIWRINDLPTFDWRIVITDTIKELHFQHTHEDSRE